MRQIPLFKVFLSPKEALMPALEDVIYSGQVSEGPPVVEFEEKFGQVLDVPNPISFYSGTAALHTALILCGVRPGDEVISTPATAIPTNQAILHAGAKIVWGDVDPANGNLDPESVGAKVTSKTKAVMPVHYGGIPVSLDRLRTVVDKYGIPVIEDAAHALGARYGGKPLGNHSEFTMFSLQAIKHMTAVDGGVLACSKPEDARQGKLVRWFGIDRTQSQATADVDIVGYKYHMNNVNATFGSVQLDHIRPVLDRHISNGKFFDLKLQNIPGLSLCSWDEQAEPSYWFYTVLVDRRDDFCKYLLENGIAASTVHRRNDTYTIFADSKCELPGTDSFYEKMAHIPCGWWVTDEDREYMVDTIKRGW